MSTEFHIIKFPFETRFLVNNENAFRYETTLSDVSYLVLFPRCFLFTQRLNYIHEQNPYECRCVERITLSSLHVLFYIRSVFIKNTNE
jgi:hypothetical protein